MHELSVTQNLVSMVVDEGKKAGADKVTEIRLVMGRCTCLMPEIVQDYFDLLSEGTIAHKAKLVFNRIPGKIICHDCKEEFEIPDFRVVCPKCGGRNTELIQGKEFYMESLEIESED